MATKARKDSRGYALKKGESQRKDGRYVFRYTTIRGEQKAVYANELSELRKKEVKIRRAIEDGLDPDRAERITLNELFDEYISQKYDLKQSTLTNYKYMYNHYVRVDFGKRRISKIKYTDVKKFYYSLIMEKGFKPNSMGCNVGCPFIGRPFDDNWGLEDPTGKDDAAFKDVIMQIHQNIIALKNRLQTI